MPPRHVVSAPSRRDWLGDAGKMVVTASLSPTYLTTADTAQTSAWKDSFLFGLDADPLSRSSLWITDLTQLYPSSAFSAEPEHGRWQVVPYEARYKGKELKGKLLLAGPETSAVPLRCPLKAQGWHAIYIGMKSFLGYGRHQRHEVQAQG